LLQPGLAAADFPFLPIPGRPTVFVTSCRSGRGDRTVELSPALCRRRPDQSRRVHYVAPASGGDQRQTWTNRAGGFQAGSRAASCAMAMMVSTSPRGVTCGVPALMRKMVFGLVVGKTAQPCSAVKR